MRWGRGKGPGVRIRLFQTSKSRDYIRPGRVQRARVWRFGESIKGGGMEQFTKASNDATPHLFQTL